LVAVLPAAFFALTVNVFTPRVAASSDSPFATVPTQPSAGARPETVSTQSYLAVTAALPLRRFFTFAGTLISMAGSDASRLIVTDSDEVPLSFAALHVYVTPVVSVVIVRASQPVLEVIDEETCQRSDTSDVYQPFSPMVPVSTGCTAGGPATTV
jgi:hypothetical protein